LVAAGGISRYHSTAMGPPSEGLHCCCCLAVLGTLHQATALQSKEQEHAWQVSHKCVCGDRGRRSCACTLIPRTGVQGHTYSLHRTHMGVPDVACEGPCAVTICCET
jgi:hypothetical protein